MAKLNSALIVQDDAAKVDKNDAKELKSGHTSSGFTSEVETIESLSFSELDAREESMILQKTVRERATLMKLETRMLKKINMPRQSYEDFAADRVSFIIEQNRHQGTTYVSHQTSPPKPK